MKQYTIKCNTIQLELIAEALEMYSRMMCGQCELTFLPPMETELEKLQKVSFDEWSGTRKEVQKHLYAIKKLIWGAPENGHYGIGYEKLSDLGYDMYKQILYTFEDEKQKECRLNNTKYHSNVHSHHPYQHTNIPLITVEIEENEEPEIKLDTTNEYDSIWSKNAGISNNTPDKSFLISFEYDYYSQGTETDYISMLIKADTFEHGCEKIKNSMLFDNPRKFENLTL